MATHTYTFAQQQFETEERQTQKSHSLCTNKWKKQMIAGHKCSASSTWCGCGLPSCMHAIAVLTTLFRTTPAIQINGHESWQKKAFTICFFFNSVIVCFVNGRFFWQVFTHQIVQWVKWAWRRRSSASASAAAVMYALQMICGRKAILLPGPTDCPSTYQHNICFVDLARCGDARRHRWNKFFLIYFAHVVEITAHNNINNRTRSEHHNNVS